MMLMTEADDLEMLLQRAEQEQGIDMTAMRQVAQDIIGMPTGDHTPPPPSRLVLPAAVHQGLNDTAEGPFYLPPFTRKPGHHYNVGDMSKKLYRTRVWVAILTMYAISATVVAVWNW